MFTKVKTQSEIQAMRDSGAILATILKLLEKKSVVGVTTLELADVARQELKSMGAKPAFLGYEGALTPFPHVLCTSVNEQVVHGIPSKDKVLSDGDILGMDFGVIYDGMITDSALSTVVGKSSQQKDRLLQDTENALIAGIMELKDGVKTGDIGCAVEQSLNKKYGIVRDLVGHGVGHELHEDPNIPNYGSRGKGSKLSAGMTIAIEPMTTLGKAQVIVEEDGWTIATADGSLSAHFEHTILITDDGYEILTDRTS